MTQNVSPRSLASIDQDTHLHPIQPVIIRDKYGVILIRGPHGPVLHRQDLNAADVKLVEQLGETAWRIAEFAWEMFKICGINAQGFIPDFSFGSGPTSYTLSYNNRESEFKFEKQDIIPEVIAHEFMHGIVAHRNPLIYQRESGALDEALADVFGIAFKKREQLRNPLFQGVRDWRIGGYRDLQQPSTMRHFEPLYDQPSLQNDYGSVHKNSQILSHAFYRMASQLEGFDPSLQIILKIWMSAFSSLQGHEKNFKGFVNQTIIRAHVEQNDRIREIVEQSWKEVGLP